MEQYFLCSLLFLPFSLQKFSYFVFGWPWKPFFVVHSWINNFLAAPGKRPSSLVSMQIYHRSTLFANKYTVESMVSCSHLPNLVQVKKRKKKQMLNSIASDDQQNDFEPRLPRYHLTCHFEHSLTAGPTFIFKVKQFIGIYFDIVRSEFKFG